MTATATTPTTLATPPVETTDVVRQLPLAKLAESPWNPRKHFDPAKLAETADSLRTSGQLTPIVVRPFRGRPGVFEIGAGHRRFRAAPQAGLTSLLAVVRDLDDVAFLELLTIENKQREDVTPLDEAAGFRLLMEKAGYDVGKLAARIGLSTKYVYDRLKLLQLVPAAKKLLEVGTITPGHAILLARLSPSDQKRAMGDLEDVADSGDYAAHRESLLLRPDNGAEGELPLHDRVKPVSVREFQQAIQREIRATPDRVDPFLFPESAEALEAAKGETLSVIQITRDYLASDAVRHDDAKAKVFGSRSWKRADGKPEDDADRRGRPVSSKICAWSRYGFVACGPGQGEVFKVCINKQKCAVHWPEYVKAAKARAKGGTSGKSDKKAAPERDSYAAEQARWRREEEARAAERKRWEQARSAILKAVAGKITSAPAGPGSALADSVLAACTEGKADPLVPRGRTHEELIRHAAFQLFAGDVRRLAPGYYEHDRSAKNLRALGLNAAKIVDEVAPKPVEPKRPTKPAKKSSKKKGGR